MVSIKNYQNEKGDVDWGAYRKAQVASGEKCYQCGGFILFDNGRRALCGECKKFQFDKDKVTSSLFYRCPKCSARQEMTDQYELFKEGEHDVWCQECEHEFKVNTWVTLTIESPALLEEVEDNA